MRKIIGAALAAMLLLSGCGSEEAAAPEVKPVQQEVMLYSSMQEQQLETIKEGFEAAHPEYQLRYQFGGTGKIMTKLNTEVQFGDVRADVILTSNPVHYVLLKENHMLYPYISTEIEDIAAPFRNDEYYYTGALLFSGVIAYNTELVAPEEAPRSWQELLDPKWKGRIIMADPYSSGSVSYIMSALMQNPAYGEQYFRRLRANGCMLDSGTMAAHRQLAEGNYAICIGLDYLTASLKDEGYPVELIYPEEDSIPIYGSVALVAGAPNEVGGKLLYDYILSRECQERLIRCHLGGVRQDALQDGLSATERMEAGMEIDIRDLCEKEGRYLKAFDQIFFSEIT